MPLLKPSNQDLASLSRFLTNLELSFVEAFSDDSLPHLPPSLTRLWLPFNRRISPKGLAKLPQSLISLNLERNELITQASELPRQLSAYVGNAQALCPPNASTGLPPLLELLELKTVLRNQSPWDVFDISKLDAPYLRHLILAVHMVHANVEPERDHVWKFPPCLETLTLRHSGCSNFTHRAVSSLPPTLTSLCLSAHHSMFIDWTDNTIPLLPRSLLRLKIKIHPSELSTPPLIFGFRPYGSKMLDVNSNTYTFSNSSIGLTHTCFKDLPRGLKDFQIPHLKASLPDISNQVDRAANKNHFEGATDFSAALEESMLLLPPTLTRFETILSADSLRQYVARISAPRHCLPPKIRRFHGNIPAGDCSSPDDKLELSSLRFGNVTYTAISTFKETGVLFAPLLDSQAKMAKLQGLWTESLESLTFSPQYAECLKLLPRSRLTYLNLDNSRVNDKSMLDLPDTLRHLVLAAAQGIITDEMIPALPLDLSTLEILGTRELRGDVYPFPRKLTSLSFSSFFKAASRSKQYLPKWSPYLTKLSIYTSLSTDETFMSLPPHLTELKLRSLNGSAFAYLPRTLLILDFSSGVAFDDNIADLPRGLRVYKARGSGEDLTDYSCSCWPPLLHTLANAATNISDEGIRQLPRSITSLEMRNPIYTTCASRYDVDELLGPSWKMALIGRRMLAFAYAVPRLR